MLGRLARIAVETVLTFYTARLGCPSMSTRLTAWKPAPRARAIIRSQPSFMARFSAAIESSRIRSYRRLPTSARIAGNGSWANERRGRVSAAAGVAVAERLRLPARGRRRPVMASATSPHQAVAHCLCKERGVGALYRSAPLPTHGTLRK